MDRVLASEAKGRGFDPRQPHQLPAIIATLGMWCIMHACIFYFSLLGHDMALHPLLIALFIAITVPVTTIFLMRAALFRARRSGLDVPPSLSQQPTGIPPEPDAGA